MCFMSFLKLLRKLRYRILEMKDKNYFFLLYFLVFLFMGLDSRNSNVEGGGNNIDFVFVVCCCYGI